jgi:hypothetical protein
MKTSIKKSIEEILSLSSYYVGPCMGFLGGLSLTVLGMESIGNALKMDPVSYYGIVMGAYAIFYGTSLAGLSTAASAWCYNNDANSNTENRKNK